MQEPTNFFQIAVDGPVAAGKGTVCRLVADKLGILYIDTGAMYRVAALLSQYHSIPPNQEKLLVDIITSATIEQHVPTSTEQDGRLITVTLDGKDVSWEIRADSINQIVPTVASLPEVRHVLVQKQQYIANRQHVIMEGRDIGLRVLPNAQLKIYLTASPESRAQRLVKQAQGKNQKLSYQHALTQLKDRDMADMLRSVDPLKKLPEAWELDTSDLSIDQAVESVLLKVKELRPDFFSTSM